LEKRLLFVKIISRAGRNRRLNFDERNEPISFNAKGNNSRIV
jgi:hypothetical protein